MSSINLEERFTINGVLTNVDSVILTNEAETAGVIRNDTGAVVVAANTPMVNSRTGVYTYEFLESEAGLTYTYFISWTYGGETYRDTKTYTAQLSSQFLSSASSMTKNNIVDWLKQEFQPLTLATPDATIRQAVDSAVRFWNTHSAYEIYQMVVPPNSGGRVQVSNEIKTVVEVYPNRVAEWVYSGHPLWTMTAIQVLDNITSDMILMSEAFKNYQIYIGTDFHWHFVKSESPTEGGWLYAENTPQDATYLCVRGTKRILPDESVTSEYILDWILKYAKALLKEIEGNTLRKAMVANIPNDGPQLVAESKEEQRELREQLEMGGRWLAFIQRS